MAHTLLDFLISPAGERLLALLAEADLSDAHRIKLVSELRKSYSMEQVSAALTQADLRQKATAKFGDKAAQMFFTDDALQQASDPLVRAYRTAQFSPSTVLDLCCGIGADSLSWAGQAASVTGVERDPLRTAMAQHNARVWGYDNVTVIVDDVTTYTPSSTFDCIFFDPARRDANGKRIFDVHRYQPPLDTLTRYDAPFKLAKVAPGVDVTQVGAAQIQFISVAGDLKEALLCYGIEAGTVAVLLQPERLPLTWTRQHPPVDIPIDAPRAWLLEPDPALIRAGLVQDAVQHFNAAMLDETIAYLTADSLPSSAWVRGWQVLDWMPFNLKKLKRYLQAQNVGTVTVKKRGSPLTPEELIRKLKLKGDVSRTLVLTRYQGEPIVVICADYTA